MLNGEHKGEDEDDARRTGYGDENEQHKRDGSYLWENNRSSVAKQVCYFGHSDGSNQAKSAPALQEKSINTISVKEAKAGLY